MEKLDWSKLSEMKPYAPTGPGKYLMRCGGVVEVSKFREGWSCGITLASWCGSGSYMDGLKHPFDIVAPAPDVLPWEECERLGRELNAAVCHHSSYINAIDKSLNCRRYSGSLMQSHLSSIELIKQQRDQYESELRAAQELNRKWRSDFDAMRDDYKQQIKQLEAERDSYKAAAEAEAQHANEQSILIDEIKAKRDEAQKNWEQLKRELNDAHYRIAQQSIRLQNQTRATQEAATHWHDRVLEKIIHLIPDEINQHGHPIEQLVGMVVTVLESKLQSAELLKLKWEKEYCEMTNQLEAERDQWKQYAEGLKQAIERPRSEADIITELHQKQIADLLQRVAKLEEATKPEAIMKVVMDTPITGLSFELNEAMPHAIEPLPAVADAVQAEKEVV